MKKKSNIVMIGMPGSGKSTVGVVLAKNMGMDFVDVDLVICRLNGGNLQEIVDRNTHEEFLRLEGQAAMTLGCENSVIATGGSMVYSETAMEYLKSMGTVVYIKVPLEDLSGRITNMETRGIAFKPGETLADLYGQRIPLYEKWAEITVESTNSDRIEDVALRIKSELNGR
ncbi:MAG: shikimate kinase [Clostridia bacterium]